MNWNQPGGWLGGLKVGSDTYHNQVFKETLTIKFVGVLPRHQPPAQTFKPPNHAHQREWATLLAFDIRVSVEIVFAHQFKIPTGMDEAYKKRKIDFVSDLTGGTSLEIVTVVLVPSVRASPSYAS